MRAADKAGADELKELLEGPTAFTFVAPETATWPWRPRRSSQFRREHDVLEPKGGRMGGEPITIEQIVELAKLPARDVLHGQLVGIVASPITGLVRGLNQLIAGLAQQLAADRGPGAGAGGARRRRRRRKEAARRGGSRPRRRPPPRSRALAEEPAAEEAGCRGARGRGAARGRGGARRPRPPRRRLSRKLKRRTR